MFLQQRREGVASSAPSRALIFVLGRDRGVFVLAVRLGTPWAEPGVPRGWEFGCWWRGCVMDVS